MKDLEIYSGKRLLAPQRRTAAKVKVALETALTRIERRPPIETAQLKPARVTVGSIDEAHNNWAKKKEPSVVITMTKSEAVMLQKVLKGYEAMCSTVADKIAELVIST